MISGERPMKRPTKRPGSPSLLPSILLLPVLALATAAQAVEPGAARERPAFADELAGRIERDVAQALAPLADLEALEALDGLDASASLGRLEQLADAQAAVVIGPGEWLAALDPPEGGGRAGAREAEATGPAIDERRPLNADGRIYVNNVAGTIDVATWERNEVSIGGRLGSEVEKLELSGDPAALSVVVRLPKKNHASGDTVLRLRVPAGARVDLESVSADVVVDGARGPVKVNTVSGDVGLALGSPEVTVQTVSGDLRLRAPARLTKVNSVSGDLRMAGLQGKLSVETVSGNVELQGGKFSELRLKSISGDMRLDVSLADAAQINGETLSGEIHMIVPNSLTGTALLKSFSGESYCDGAHTVENRSGRKREYVWGDGHGARIELSSFSGDIRIERK